MELFLATGAVSIGLIIFGKVFIHITSKNEIEDWARPLCLFMNHVVYKKFILYGRIELGFSLLGLILPYDIWFVILMLQVIFIYVAIAHMMFSGYNFIKKHQKA